MSKDTAFTLKEVVIELKEAVTELNKTVRNKQDCDSKHNKLDKRIDKIYAWFWSFIAIFISAFSYLASKIGG